MRILVTGKNGQVGYELERSLACLGEVIACDRQSLDLADDKRLLTALTDLKPDLIVNAAAYTAVDKAELEPDLAFQINARAPEVMAQYATKSAIPLIHYSTDYVFNGDNQSPWQESDQTEPLGVYGKTKLDGEIAIQASGCAHLIFRTSWVYGCRGHNFLLTMRRLAAEKSELNVVDDQIGAPTWSRHIADVTAQIIAQSKLDPTFWQQHSGLYHLTASGKGSWCDFAKAIFAEMAAVGSTVPVVHPINSDAYPTPAKRPHYSCLDNSKLTQHFQLQLPDWQQSLKFVMKALA